jgi:hypothetical protein
MASFRRFGCSSCDRTNIIILLAWSVLEVQPQSFVPTAGNARRRTLGDSSGESRRKQVGYIKLVKAAQ